MKDINPDGYVYLVQKLVRDARFDFMHSKPGTNRRTDVEEFVLSEWFTDLTGLEGWKVLRKWDEEYAARHSRPKKGDRKRSKSKMVQCIETGKVFESCMMAAETAGVHSSCITWACASTNHTAAGMHYKFVEEQQHDIQ